MNNDRIQKLSIELRFILVLVVQKSKLFKLTIQFPHTFHSGKHSFVVVFCTQLYHTMNQKRKPSLFCCRYCFSNFQMLSIFIQSIVNIET